MKNIISTRFFIFVIFPTVMLLVFFSCGPSVDFDIQLSPVLRSDYLLSNSIARYSRENKPLAISIAHPLNASVPHFSIKREVPGYTIQARYTSATVFVVSHRSPLYNLSKPLYSKIISGNRVYWKDIREKVWSVLSDRGGRMVRVYALKGLVKNPGDAVTVLDSAKKVIDQLSRDVGAIGLLPLSEVSAAVKIVPVDMVYPTTIAIRERRYPAGREIYLQIPADKEISDKGRHFISWVKKDSRRTIRFLAGGDVIPARGVSMVAVKKGWEHPFKNFYKYFNASDLSFVNWESPISSRGVKPDKKYFFRTPPAILPALRKLKLSVVSFANNHSMDFGIIAAQDTIKYFKKLGVRVSGFGDSRIKAVRPTVLTRNGVRFAFLSYSWVWPYLSDARPNRAGYASPDLKTLKAEIVAARKKADIVVVSIHDGTEYKRFPDRRKVVFSRRAIKYGADLVLGHHPHWYQGYEQRGNGFIFYSLGNFIFDQTWSEETKCGMLAEILIKDGTVQAFLPIPVYNNWYNFMVMEGRLRRAFLKKFAIRSFPYNKHVRL